VWAFDQASVNMKLDAPAGFGPDQGDGNLKGREITFLIIALVLGAVVGGLIGDIIGSLLPEGAVKTLFEKSIDIGLRPTTVELYAISFTIGLLVKINFVSILFIILVVIYFRWWFL
jgi:hypothetical protein